MDTSDDSASAADDSKDVAYARNVSLSLQLQDACRAGDTTKCQDLIQKGAAAWYQDEIGWTALHYAAESQSIDIVKYLLKHGATWSITDRFGFTAGDVAYSLNDDEIYQAINMEGVREELLKAVLEAAVNEDAMSDAGSTDKSAHGDSADSGHVVEQPSTASDNVFLQSKLRFEGSGADLRCVDEEHNGVMMGWETPIMEETARLLCQARNPDDDDQEFAVLNIGFGLGIVDTMLQSYKPTRHVIVEPHPDVIAFAKSNGWYDKPGVRIFEGTWQQYIIAFERGDEEAEFDAIYYDTFSEQYADHRAFFEHLPNLLRDESACFSFFHGLGATSMSLYECYTHVAEIHLREIGLITEWHTVGMLDKGEVTWDGIVRRVSSIEMKTSPY